MAGKVVTTAAPTKQETAAAKSYVGSTRASQSNGLNVRETAGSDASKVNYYKGSAAHSAATSSAAHQQYMDTVRTKASRDELFGPLRDAASYLSSGQTNSQTSSEWLKIANDNAANNQDEEIRGYWSQMANEFRSALASDYSRDLSSYKEQLSKLQDEDKTLSGNLKNTSRSVEAGMYDTAMLKAYDDGIKQRANNKTQQAELNAKIAEIENTIFDSLATDEVKEARARLTKDKYDAEWGYLAPGEAVTQRDLDQQLVDQFMESIGQQTQYYNFADRANAILTRFGENLAGSAGNLAALGLSEADFYNSLPEDMRALVSDPEAMSKATPEQLAQIQAYREQFDANTGNGGRLAAMTDKAEAWADQHDQQAAEEIRKAKQGLGKLGQFGIDLASTALDVGFDAATGLGLGSMAARVMGSSAGEARRAGATTDQQIAYGLTNTAIELLTEKMTDGLGMVYGKGVPTDIAEKVINKLAKTDAGANLLRLLNAGLGEGAEEVVSDLLSPFAQWIIDENARDNRIYDVDPDQLLYDFLLGSAMGLMGGGQEALSGGFAQSNAEHKAEEQARFDKMYEEGAQFTDKDVRNLNRLESRINSEPQNRAKQQAEEDMPGQAHSRLTKEDNKTQKKDALGNPINRMRRITERTARVAEKLGYGNKSDQGEAYKTATGKTIEEANAEADAESWKEAHNTEPVKGGDEAKYDLSNYDQAGLNKLWKNHDLTSGQYAEAMVQRGFWSEATARSFLSTSRQNGASPAERKRDLGNYTIGQNNAQNAPQGQAVSEGTPAPAETEKTVKPQAEIAETSSQTEGDQTSVTETTATPSDEKILAADEESIQQQDSGSSPSVQSPVASGTIKESDSEALRKQTARGEEKAVRDSGATFVSKTNADRSRIADHQLRDENWDNEINRLLSKDERWDDQDVVTAERAMYKMIRAIRDYQLGNKRKMPRKAFDALKERYNNLTLRHIEEKSKAGQELQATYQFTPAERIMNRMAKTFLGFAKDGTFAGKTELAVNAKIYAAAEDAANRITEAVEAKDAKALAQICKDISDIRGVKNMFGIASGFASKVESEILDAIAKQDNGVEALETLALGNLNAICDDVQPYKVVNAAKTIRIMNMLSNISTDMNNVTNNIASGLTSTNALAQGSSLLASKAFEKITGQKVLTPAAKGWVANKEIRNAEMEALKMATLVQMYGVNQENGKLEISGDKGLFNPNANAFEQTMAMYKFFVGMGVEATDQVKSEGLMKAMNIGIDKALAKEKITEKQAEAMRKEAAHEVRRLLYKDDNRLSGFVQGVRNKLNKVKSWGNDDIGTIGLGDITMAFAKVPANVVRARLYATPEGCLVQLAQYTKGVMKAKRMHSEVMARQIMEDHAAELKKLRTELQDAKELETRIVGREAKDAKIEEINKKIAAVNRQCWNEAREKCSGGVYNKLVKKRDNYGAGLDFDDCVQRCKYDDAKEMSQFEAATYSRKIGKAATSAGMVALGAVLRGLGALRDFDQEPDDELRKMYKQKGYSGLMFNWSAIGRPDHEWRDGDIILDADFLEVVAMPLAIGACAKECAMNVEGKGKTKAFVNEAAASGLSKTFEAVGDIPGMADAVNLYNAITSQFNTDNAAKGNRVFNAGVQYLANTLPSFLIPNAYTQLGAGLDNTVRDTYTTDNIWQQAGNIMLNKTAFLRKKIPASVDMWGEERQYGEDKFWGVVNKTLLPGDRIKYRQNKYESEIIRLTKEGYKGATPKLSVSGSFEVDGETYTMDADEKRAFRQNRNTEQAEVYQQFMDSPEYDLLSDEQKVAVLKDLKMDCERDAKQAMLNDRGLDVEVTRAKWETELPTTKEQITYLSMKQLAGAAWDSEENRVSDYAAMDSFLKDHYGDMTKEMRDILDGSMSQLDKMYDASKAGIDSEMWQKAYDIYRQYNSEEGQDAVDGGFKDWEATEMWTKIEKATGASNAQMNWFEKNMGLMRHMRVNPEHYQDLTDKLGWSRESASNLTKSMSELQPSNGNKTVSYKQRLRCIAESKGTTDDQKWEAFYEYCPSSYTKIIKGMTNLRNRGYTYEQALKTYKSGKNSMWWVYEGE